MNEKLEKNENKKTADVLRAENLVRDYVQYGEDGTFETIGYDRPSDRRKAVL